MTLAPDHSSAIAGARGACASALVASFRRTLPGERGTLVVVGDATADLADPATPSAAGAWSVESETGTQAVRAGSGAGTGTTDVTHGPPYERLCCDGALR